MKHKTILFVCSGNTCRSPMAEAALKAELKRRKIRWYSVRSAGLNATDGAPISRDAANALREAKIPLSAKFVSRKLTDKMCEEAFAIVCMTQAHQKSLSKYQSATSFYELCGRDIPDPYGQGEAVYRATLEVLCACMPVVIKKLIPVKE